MEEYEKQENSSEDKVEILKKAFQTQRETWKKRIRKISNLMKSNENLAEVQSILFSDIMNLIDEKTSLVEALIGLNKIVRPKKSESLRNIKLSLDLNIKTTSEQSIMLDADLNTYIERQELLDMQISFMDLTLKNLNQMVWGIKNYIDLDKAGMN